MSDRWKLYKKCDDFRVQAPQSVQDMRMISSAWYMSGLLKLILMGYNADSCKDYPTVLCTRRKGMITRDEAFELLKKYNKDPFHIQHALTVEAVMKWYAKELGYSEEMDYWEIVGLLHDIDFELYPEEHCIKAPELLREGGVSEDIIHAVCSHGYGITVGCGVTIDVEPVHEMEKVLFAADELTGLVWAAALMRPSKSTKDMELKSLKKKYKSKGFAAGCSREVIERGAYQLGWELDKLLEMTLKAMAESEDLINEKMESVA